MAPTLELTIRTATRADAFAIYTTHAASFIRLCATHYPVDVLRRWFASKTVEGYFPALERGEMFVCEVGSTVAGFGHAVPGTVEAIFVHPDYARQGVGARLLAHALLHARRPPSEAVHLFATLNAVRFYEKHGFTAVQRLVVSRGGVDFPVVEMVLAGEATER